MSHGLSSTDVTRMADKKGANAYASSRNENKQRYVDSLSHQVGLSQCFCSTVDLKTDLWKSTNTKIYPA